MIKRISNNIIIAATVSASLGMIWQTVARAETNNAQATEALIYDSYRDYVEVSRAYLQTQNDASLIVRDWRRKRLAEIFNEKLERTERTLLMSNSNLIEEFNKFIKKNGVDSLDDVLIIRLAQLYFEKSSLEFNNKMKSFGGGSDVSLPVPDYRKAILFAKLFIAKFPNTAIGDKGYYLLGIAHEEMNQALESASYYEALLSKYPASEFSEEVAWRLAEIYFAQKKYNDATRIYTRLIKVKGSYYTKALYKIGATYFAERKFKNSVRAFEMAIKEVERSSNQTLDDQVVVNESLDYLATILSNDSSVVIDSDYLPEAHYRLGLLYKKRLDEKSMQKVYANATQRFKTAKQLPLMFNEIIKSYEDSGEFAKANKARSEFVAILTKNADWWNGNSNYRTSYFEAQDNLEFNLIKSAEFHSENGYRNKDMKQLQIAKDRYTSFVAEYPWSSYKYYALLELADLEYYLGNYQKASSIYFEIVNESSSETLREEAAYSLIWSETKKVDYKLNFDERLRATSTQKINLSSEEKVFTQAAIFYITKIAFSHRRNQVLYKLAEVYADRGDVDNAILYLNYIVEDNEASDMKLAAFRFLEQVYNLKGDWAAIEKTRSRAALSYFGSEIDSLDKENIRQRHRVTLEESYNFEMAGKFFDAGVSLEKIVNGNSKSPIVDFLRLKAASLYVKSNHFAKAESLIGMLGQTKYRAEAQFLKAQILYRVAQFESAAYELENFVLVNRKHPWAETALANIFSIRNKTQTQTKTIALINKLNPQSLNPDLYYKHVENLLAINRLDEVYKAIGKVARNPKYDGFRMQYLILVAQNNRFDYVGLEKTCATIINLPATLQTAYANQNRSFCEYAKLKMIVGQSETTLDGTVNALNRIHSHRVSPVTTMALTEILNKSDLKNQFRTQFEQLISKGWTLAKQNPLTRESQDLSRAIINYNGRLPLSMAYMINWKAALAELFDYQELNSSTATSETLEARNEAKLLCDSKQYRECTIALQKMLKTDGSDTVYENLIITSLKMDNDADTKKWFAEFGKNKKSIERYQIYARLLGWSEPAGYEIKLESEDPLSVAAKALELWKGNRINEATNLIEAGLKRDPTASPLYYVLAQILFEQGKYELAHTVVELGANNAHSRALASLKHQFDAVSNLSEVPRDDFTPDLSPAELFALGFYAIKIKDVKSLNRVYAILKSSGGWFESLKSLELVSSDNRKSKDIRSGAAYSKWLHALYEISQGRSELSLPKIASTAQELYATPSYKELERTINQRSVAGESK